MNKTPLKILAYLIPFFSALSFSIQPIIGKSILPIQGGNISSWLTLMLFFQMSLLIGYSAAYLINKFTFKKQLLITSCFAVLSIFILNLDFSNLPLVSNSYLLLLLIQKMLIPMAFLFSFSILIQGWLSLHNSSVPYYLYGISNLGSFAGLVSYPFIIERYAGLSSQVFYWSSIFILLASIVFAISLYLLRYSTNITPSDNNQPISKSRYFLWLFLSFTPCITFLEITRILSMEWGSNPFTWILPLGFYLLSFTITFTDWGWSKVKYKYLFLILFTGLLLYTILHGGVYRTFSDITFLSLTLISIGGILGALRLLYMSKPQINQNFTHFYLCIGLGGVLGGIFENFIAPFIFTRPIEMILINSILLCISFIYIFSLKPSLKNINRMLIPSTYLFSIIILLNIFIEKSNFPDRIHYRSNFGTYTVNEVNIGSDIIIRNILSGYTMHGVQNLNQPMQPVNYYWKDSGIGLWTRFYQQNSPSSQVAVIGLGAGVLSAYNRINDKVAYYEIDPLVKYLAYKYFTFLTDSPGNNQVIIEDGRIGVRYSNNMYDYVVVDAFSGDGIPLYLLTKEAIKDYMEKSSSGVVIMHISNRYWNLTPIIRGSAEQNGYLSFFIDTELRDDISHYLATNSQYAIIYRPSSQNLINNFVQFVDSLNKDNIFLFHPSADTIYWTDDKYSIFSIPRLIY